MKKMNEQEFIDYWLSQTNNPAKTEDAKWFAKGGLIYFPARDGDAAFPMFKPERCACGDPKCKGWQMESLPLDVILAGKGN